MKFIHLGDLHIGKTLGDFELIEDQRYLLGQVIETAVEKEADAVVIAGDVYDKPIPSEAAVSLFDDFIYKLSEKKIKTFIISGNHDSDERLNFGSRLLEAKDIFISAKYEGKLYHQVIKDEEGDVNVYLLPFVKASQVRHFFPEEEIDSYDKAVRVILQHAEIDRTKRNILAAHQFVAGKGESPKLGGSEGMAVQSVGLVEQIGYDCFEMFDYVALGHIHSPQKVGREEVRYSGSLMKYSLSEVNNDKSVTIVNIGKKGSVEIETAALKPVRNMRHLKGKLKKLLEKENIKDTQDFIYATLTDEDVVNDAMSIFQQYYPNTLKIDYENSHTRELESVGEVKKFEPKSFDSLISDFYSLMYGCEISEEELKIMKECAREAGVADEAD